VTVLTRRVVGVYDIAVLAAKDAAALSAWLTKYGYAWPKGRNEVLAHYTKKAWVYAALRIDPSQLDSDEVRKLKTGELQPIRFAFATREMVYPLHISSVNAGKTEVLLYLLADAPMVYASGPDHAGFSADRIVPRYIMAGYNCDPEYTTLPRVAQKALPLTWEALGLRKDAQCYLCKYRADYTSRTMTDDLAFKPFEPLPYWKAKLAEARNLGEKLRAYQFLALLDASYEKGVEETKRLIEEERKHQAAQALAKRQDEIRQQARVTRLLQERALIAATPQTAAAGGTP